MIVGAAVLPTAPLLVPGVSGILPDGIRRVADAVDAAVEGLPDADLVVLVASGDGALHDTGHATLAGIGRPDIAVVAEAESAAVAQLGAVTQYQIISGEELPLDLAVLVFHLGDATPLVPLTVPALAGFGALVGVGAAITRTFADPHLRTTTVVAGDLSTGLTEQSPLHLVDGALFWDEQAVAAVDSGRLDRLASLGPEEAVRVGARAWAPLAVLHGVTATAKLGMVVRHYSAPRGAGYLVAGGG